MFNFFLKSYRFGILTFCGVNVDVVYDKDGPEGKNCFKLFEDGRFKNQVLKSRHPNIFKGVVTGKKSWGLWVDSWTDGITEKSFTKKEVLSQFTDNGIEIPESFLKDFDNVLEKKRIKRIEKEIERLQSGGMWI